MKLLLLAALASLQLLATVRANNSGVTPPPRPIYVDPLPQNPNRRYARSTDDDFQVFFDREVSSIIQEEIDKAIKEVMNDDGISHVDEEVYRHRRSVNPFARPPPPPRRPIITDDLRGANRRFARSTNDDLQAFFHSEVSPIIQAEVHKAFQEVINDNGRSHADDEELGRYRRSVNPFARPPPPPRRPIITDDLRAANRRYARDTRLVQQIEPELKRERRELQIPGYKKPTHHDIIIPNWNPNARTQPWQHLGVRNRREVAPLEQYVRERRSYDSRSHASRGTSSSSSSHDTGSTHPGYNRRNA